MDGKVREIHKEGTILVLFDETNRFFAKAVSDVFAGRTFGERRDFVRRKITGRLRSVRAGNVQIEALFLGKIFFAAEMPFANADGRVTARFENASERRLG